MRKLARWGLGSFATATVLMTVAHLPPVSGWLGWNHHGGSGTCPFGYGKAQTPRAASRVHQDGPAAHARPALGFELDKTTRADVIAWAATRGVWCSGSRGGSELACTSAPLAGLAAKSMWFDFDDDIVSGIRTVRRAAEPTAVASTFEAVTGTITAEAGAPAHTSGNAGELSAGAFQQAVAEYRFRDYAATLRATNMGDGYVLTESYAAL